MQFVGGAIFAIVLVGCIAACAVLTPIYVNYLCHLLLAVYTETAAGADDIQWPDEPFFDRWWKAGWCIAALGVCGAITLFVVIPFLLLGPLAGAIAAGVLLSILFPLALLSGTFAPELIGPLHGEAYLAILRWPKAWIVAWLWGTPFAAGAVACLAATLLWTPNAVIGMGILVPPAVFFFSRSWGCFTWLATAGKRRTQKKNATTEAALAAQVVDPWSAPLQKPTEDDIPEIDVEEWADGPEDAEDEWQNEKKPYGLAAETAGPEADKLVRMEEFLAVDRKAAAAREVRLSRFERKPTFRKAMGWRVPAVFAKGGTAGHAIALGLFTWVEFGIVAAIWWMVLKLV